MAVINGNQDQSGGDLKATVINAQDYYAFGSQMPGRSFNLGGSYRYGFNGKENDNEVKGQGNQQDYGMRIYDPRIAKFLSVDPITDQYPELTPYQFASNRPIDGIDRDGLEHERSVGGSAPDFSLFNLFLPKNKKLQFAETEAMRQASQKGLALGSAIGLALPFDIYNGGKITTFMVLSGAFHHNRGKTPQARAMQDADSWNSIRDAAMIWIGGKAFEKVFSIYKSARLLVSAQTAEEANAILIAKNPLTRPPYAAGTPVVDQVTTSTEKFVRVFTKDITTAEGKWVMPASEVKGLTPAQIQDKFALPNTPTHIVDVMVPKGTSIRTSIAGKLEGWGNGGGMQTELMERGASFSNPRPLPSGGN